MKLNGWQRLWVVLAALWTALVVLIAAASMPRHSYQVDPVGWTPGPAPGTSTYVDPDEVGKRQREAFDAVTKARRTHVQNAIMLSAIPPAFLYGFGYAVAWIRKGFRPDS